MIIYMNIAMQNCKLISYQQLKISFQTRDPNVLLIGGSSADHRGGTKLGGIQYLIAAN